MIILLSPSKTLDMDAKAPHGKPTQPRFLEQTETLAAIMKKQSTSDLKKLMGISDKLAELNEARFKAFSTPFTRLNATPALYAFQGDVYEGMDAASFSAEDVAFAQTHLRMLSGFYGLLRPMDLMQAYRLEMGIKLNNAKGKDLYAFWGEALQRQIAKEADYVVNLASQEYAKAAKLGTIEKPVITPIFKEKKGNQLKVIALMAKRARGRMARWIIQHRLTQPELLSQFAEDGYRFDPHLSNEQELTFTR